MAAKGDTEFGRDLIESLEQAVAIVEDPRGAGRRQCRPTPKSRLRSWGVGFQPTFRLHHRPSAAGSRLSNDSACASGARAADPQVRRRPARRSGTI